MCPKCGDKRYIDKAPCDCLKEYVYQTRLGSLYAQGDKPIFDGKMAEFLLQRQDTNLLILKDLEKFKLSLCGAILQIQSLKDVRFIRSIDLFNSVVSETAVNLINPISHLIEADLSIILLGTEPAWGKMLGMIGDLIESITFERSLQKRPTWIILQRSKDEIGSRYSFPLSNRVDKWEVVEK